MASKPETIRARFENRVIEPLENLELKDGEEVYANHYPRL